VGSPRVPGRPGVGGGVSTTSGRPWRDQSPSVPPNASRSRFAVFEWIEVFYNRQRIHTTLGGYAPEEFETLSLNQAREVA
jgi:transposase InsO family protein